MKHLLLSLALIVPFLLQAQTINETYDGEARSYLKYIPSSYNGSEAVPLLFALHGLGDNVANFSGVGFHQLADANNFIVVTPQALVAILFSVPIGTAWNSGAGVAVGPSVITLNDDVDDIGWLESIMDAMISQYNIDTDRIYSTGFSMGSFMSQRLACELNDRVAAIASVAGAIGNGLDCQPGRAVPMCHFHGTADGTVGYTGNTYGTDAQVTVDFWRDNNGCDASPTSSTEGNITHYEYNNCDADVEFFSAEGVDHTWLFSPFNYTNEIWNFLSRQSLNAGTVNAAPVAQNDTETTDQDVAVTVDVLDNDNDSDGNLLAATVTVTSAPSNGTTSVNTTNGFITYTPASGFSGTDQFTYQVCDDGDPQECASATVTVTVNAVVGVYDHLRSSIEIYPNPMSDNGFVTLDLDKNTILNLEILDITGAVVKSTAHEVDFGVNQVPVDASELSKGTYLLTIEIDGDRISKPFIKQ